MNWQPIETAPKDGTEILACIAGFEGVGLARWHNREQDWLIADFIAPEFAGEDFGITHWMPLPEPPEEVEAEG